jgi:putative ABC transport system permease protein
MLTFKLGRRFAFRDKWRAAITAIAISVTLIAFLLMRSLVSSWYTINDEVAASDQFTIRHKISISFRLGRHMEPRIMSVPGVEAVSPLIWYSGNYKEEKTRFGQLAVDATQYFKIYPQYRPPAEQLQSFLEDRSGAVVGPALVKKYGWKIGDRVTLVGTMYKGELPLTIRGIYSEAEGYNADWLFMHYDRLKPSNDHAHQLVVKATPEAALAIDALFATTDTPTKTESEHALRRSWASWSVAVVSAINWGSALVLGILMLVLGNGMAMAVRDSAREHAAMRAIGFHSGRIVALVMMEGAIVVFIGVVLGLAAMPAVLELFSKALEQRLGGSWQLELKLGSTLNAVSLAFLAGVLAAAWPAWRTRQVPIVDALKKLT